MQISCHERHGTCGKQQSNHGERKLSSHVHTCQPPGRFRILCIISRCCCPLTRLSCKSFVSGTWCTRRKLINVGYTAISRETTALYATNCEHRVGVLKGLL